MPRFETRIYAYDPPHDALRLAATTCRLLRRLGVPNADIDYFRQEFAAAETYCDALTAIERWFPVVISPRRTKVVEYIYVREKPSVSSPETRKKPVASAVTTQLWIDDVPATITTVERQSDDSDVTLVETQDIADLWISVPGEAFKHKVAGFASIRLAAYSKSNPNTDRTFTSWLEIFVDRDQLRKIGAFIDMALKSER